MAGPNPGLIDDHLKLYRRTLPLKPNHYRNPAPWTTPVDFLTFVDTLIPEPRNYRITVTFSLYFPILNSSCLPELRNNVTVIINNNSTDLLFATDDRKIEGFYTSYVDAAAAIEGMHEWKSAIDLSPLRRMGCRVNVKANIRDRQVHGSPDLGLPMNRCEERGQTRDIFCGCAPCEDKWCRGFFQCHVPYTQRRKKQ